MIELWYCTSAFLVTQSSYWYQNICPCDLGLLWNWPLSGAFVFHKNASLCSIQKWHMKHWDWTWSIKSCYEHAYIKICLIWFIKCACVESTCSDRILPLTLKGSAVDDDLSYSTLVVRLCEHQRNIVIPILNM